MKLKQVSRFTAAVAVLFGVSGMSIGCLEDNGPADGVGGNAVGGTGGASGSGGSGMGGGTSGTGGAAVGGTGGGGANMDPMTPLAEGQCGGISNNQACPLIGTCSDRPCGIADYGTRDCVCQPSGAVSAWSCTSCAFDMTNLPAVLVPPGAGAGDAGDAGDAGGGGALEACAAGIGDNVPCTEGDRCKQGTGATAELCVCLLREDDGAGQLIWDCDDPPNFWPPGSF